MALEASDACSWISGDYNMVPTASFVIAGRKKCASPLNGATLPKEAAFVWAKTGMRLAQYTNWRHGISESKAMGHMSCLALPS